LPALTIAPGVVISPATLKFAAGGLGGPAGCIGIPCAAVVRRTSSSFFVGVSAAIA
jgi:hypothetical protein